MSAAELPEGWAQATVADVADACLGKMLDAAKNRGELRPYLRNINVRWGGFDLSDVSSMRFEDSELDRYGVRKGDVVICEGGEPGRCAVWRSDEPVLIQKALHRARCGEAIEPEFLAHHLRWDADSGVLKDGQAGTTIQHLPGVALAAHRLRVPPAPEQKRIVAKLDALLSRSRAAREALADVPALLDTFRHSVLAAAFRGDLTAEWRAKNPNVEPRTALLQRIRVERKRRWEKENPRKKYVEPVPVDDSELPSLPDTWTWALLPEIGAVARGKSRHRPRNDKALYVGGTHPFIQTGEVARSGGRIADASAFYNDFGLGQSRMFPAGTVCITIAANIASTAVLDIAACFPDSVVGVEVDARLISPELLEVYIRTIRADLERFAPATAQKNINLEVLSQVAVPLMPPAERAELDRLLGEAMGVIAACGTSMKEAESELDTLDQAILARAFRGELVDQDPNDEPAEVMLARIKAAPGGGARVGRKGSSPGVRRGRGGSG